MAFKFIMSKSEVVERLKQHLQTAVMIECATLPPYLCAYWSIYGTSPDAKNAKKFIGSIIKEEMLHMAMACNILNAIGGSPVLNDPSLHPSYPCPLPGHSKTNNAFIVELNKCCPASIANFVKIELPEKFYGNKHHQDGWCTIGEFYDAIAALINSETLIDADFQHGKQAGNKFNPAHGTLYEVHSRADALTVLTEIIDQGEGYSGEMYDKDHQLTHYWKFQSIHDLMVNELWDFESEVYDMAANPDESFFSEEAKKLNLEFNTVWTQLLDTLHEAFNSESPALDKSIDMMFQLNNPAVALMQIPLSGKAGNAGPTFEFIPATGENY